MTTHTRIVSTLAIIATLTAVTPAPGGAFASGMSKGGTPVKHHPVHGPGSSHNPIIRHAPLHGAGSSHNPIVVPRDCDDPNVLCRRP